MNDDDLVFATKEVLLNKENNGQDAQVKKRKKRGA